MLISILCAVSALISILITRLAGIAVDDYIAVGDMPGLARLVGVSLLLYAVTTVCSYFQNTNMIYVAQKTSFKFRKDLFDCLSELPLKYFDTHSSGDIMSRLTNDVDNVSNTLSQSVTQLFSGVINVVGTLVAMISAQPPADADLDAHHASDVPRHAHHRAFSRRFFREQQKNLGTINGYIEEMVSGQKVIKLFSREEENKRDFAGLNANLRRSGTKAEVVAGRDGPVHEHDQQHHLPHRRSRGRLAGHSLGKRLGRHGDDRHRVLLPALHEELRTSAFGNCQPVQHHPVGAGRRGACLPGHG